MNLIKKTLIAIDSRDKYQTMKLITNNSWFPYPIPKLFKIKAPLLQMGGKWQIITGSAIIRTLVERQALEELHEVNNHQEELGGSGYSSRETPNRQTQMNKN